MDTNRSVATSFKRSDKCSWLVKANVGAPSFQLTADPGTIASDWDIHYVEYDSYVSTKGSGNDFILFSKESNSNSISATNRVGAKNYFKLYYDKYLEPDVY